MTAPDSTALALAALRASVSMALSPARTLHKNLAALHPSAVEQIGPEAHAAVLNATEELRVILQIVDGKIAEAAAAVDAVVSAFPSIVATLPPDFQAAVKQALHEAGMRIASEVNRRIVQVGSGAASGGGRLVLPS